MYNFNIAMEYPAEILTPTIYGHGLCGGAPKFSLCPIDKLLWWCFHCELFRLTLLLPVCKLVRARPPSSSVLLCLLIGPRAADARSPVSPASHLHVYALVPCSSTKGAAMGIFKKVDLLSARAEIKTALINHPYCFFFFLLLMLASTVSQIKN